MTADLEATSTAGAGDDRSAVGRRRSARSFGAALGLTALGALLPGTAFLAAGRRRLGGVILLAFLLLVAGVVSLATFGQRAAAGLAVDTTALLWVIVVVALIGLAWVLAIVAGYRMLAPDRVTQAQHVVGSVVVALLALGVALPAVQVARLANAQRNLVAGVFADDRRSATVTEPPDRANPFGDDRRVNVLLLGGDYGPGREGVRTDTVIVASIDTRTGNTTLLSLPRNLENVPFPAGSPLARVYPNGFQAGAESESLLNAIYRNGPAAYPDILGPTDNPGADFVKLGVGAALGLTIDYFVLINLEGFSRLVDALGGITVNINYWVPVNGIPDSAVLPDDYLRPGPNQHLNGYQALQFARGRYGLSDYDRMARQRCTIDAIIQAADPVTLLSKYQQLASTTQDIVSTDIPRSVLDDFVDLAFLVKDASVRSVVFDNSVITPAYPDYGKIRRIVQAAINPPAATGAAPTSAAGPPPATVPVADVGDACAYDPVRAQAALAAGKPPVRGG